MNNRYLVSIDSGGSKTAFCMLDRVTGQKVRCVSGSGNYKSQGIETVKANLLAGFRQLGIDPSEVDFTALGSAGCDAEADKLVYRGIMAELGIPGDRLFVCNDAEFIFRALSDAPGICLIAGTGSIGFSFTKDGTVRRVGGWGAPLSDNGSGYWIGGAFIRAFLDRVDGLSEDDPSFETFRDHYQDNITLQELAAKLAESSTSEIASWARFVLENAETNKLCKKITVSAAEKLADIVAGVYKLTSFDKETNVTIVMSGSLFKNTFFRELVQKTVSARLKNENYSYIYSLGDPAEDGLRLAEKLAQK